MGWDSNPRHPQGYNGYKNRYIILLPSDRMNALKGVQRTFWDAMSDLLNSIEMQTALNNC